MKYFIQIFILVTKTIIVFIKIELPSTISNIVPFGQRLDNSESPEDRYSPFFPFIFAGSGDLFLLLISCFPEEPSLFFCPFMISFS